MRPSSWPQISDPPSGPLLHNLLDLRLKTHVQHSIGLGTAGTGVRGWPLEKSHWDARNIQATLTLSTPKLAHVDSMYTMTCRGMRHSEFQKKIWKIYLYIYIFTYIYIYIIFWLRSGSTYGLKTTTLKQSHVEIGNLQFRHCGVLFKTCFFSIAI